MVIVTTPATLMRAMTTSGMIFAIASSQCGEIVMTAIAIGNATIGLATATSTARSAASTAPGRASSPPQALSQAL